MAIQLLIAARNARLDAIETVGGTSVILSIWDGTKPEDCATANAGTLLVSMTLPSDWMAAASNGQKAKSGTWEDTSADGTGTAEYFRIHNSAGTECLMQGDVGQGTGDLQLDNTSIATGQQVTVTTFTLTDGNA